LIAYLDTQIVVWLAQGDQKRLTKRARDAVAGAALLLSPMVLLELEYMHEIGRIKPSGRDVQHKIEAELDATVCSLPFQRVAEIARDERWTRDPFDRIIVAQAKANGLAYLISADQMIAEHYPRTIW
jgi:PIN domain nuclease of toxin-antitoxin system